jgi:hypothetical protein
MLLFLICRRLSAPAIPHPTTPYSWALPRPPVRDSLPLSCLRKIAPIPPSPTRPPLSCPSQSLHAMPSLPFLPGQPTPKPEMPTIIGRGKGGRPTPSGLPTQSTTLHNPIYSPSLFSSQPFPIPLTVLPHPLYNPSPFSSPLPVPFPRQWPSPPFPTSDVPLRNPRRALGSSPQSRPA